jgi:hypothetical protein
VIKTPLSAFLSPVTQVTRFSPFIGDKKRPLIRAIREIRGLISPSLYQPTDRAKPFSMPNKKCSILNAQ